MHQENLILANPNIHSIEHLLISFNSFLKAGVHFGNAILTQCETKKIVLLVQKEFSFLCIGSFHIQSK